MFKFLLFLSLMSTSFLICEACFGKSDDGDGIRLNVRSVNKGKGRSDFVHLIEEIVIQEETYIFEQPPTDFSFNNFHVSACTLANGKLFNQDRYDIREIHDGFAFAVFDGHGRYIFAEQARTIFMDVLQERLNSKIVRSDVRGMKYVERNDDVSILLSVIEEFGHFALELGREKIKEICGTTYAVGFIRSGKTFIANAGDSRVLLLMEDGEVRRFSIDHSPVSFFLQ